MQSATLRDVRTGLDEVQAGRAPARARRGEGSLLRDGPYANGCVEPASCEFEPSLRRQARILEIGYQRPATASSRFEIVDIPPDTIKEIASGTTISNCNGCQRRFAQMVGANWAAWGTVQKVSNLILNINVYMQDAESGKMKFARSVDIRGNTDESWRRGLDYLLRNYLLREP